MKLESISELPRTTSVYALYGGSSRNLYVAYVGIANNLKSRIRQHLVRRDSSVATQTSAAALVPDHVTEVAWWEHPSFAERYVLEAAELIAIRVLDPALRSRGRPQAKALELVEKDPFAAEMRTLFMGEPVGRMVILTLQDALARIEKLERRLASLEQQPTKRG